MCLVNSKIAREVGRLHDWREKVWGRRYRAIVLAQEEAVHLDRLRYQIAHGVKEGLVERVLDWPGVHCAQALLTGEPLESKWFNRTQEYRLLNRGESYDPLEFATSETLSLSPLPCWADLSPDRIRSRVQELIDQVEHEAAVKRKNGQLPKRPMGPARIRKQRPHHKPKKIKKSPAPAFHAATKAFLRELQEAYRIFLNAYRLASAKLRRGETDVEFPEGSFPPALPFVPRGSPLIDPG